MECRASRDDVISVYEAFLGRLPESDQVVAEKLGSNILSLIAEVVESEEFETRVLTPAVLRMPSEWALCAFDRSKLLWFENVLEIKLQVGDGLGRLMTALSASEAWKRAEFRSARTLTRLGSALLARPPNATVANTEETSRDLVLASGLWSEVFVASQVADHSGDLLDLFLNCNQDFSPHPLFDSSFYLSLNPDVRAAGVNPLVHFLRHGDLEDRWPNPLFSPDWYRRAYELSPERNALSHYVLEGERQGAKPHPLFDAAAYLARYADVRDAAVDPYTHYVRHGHKEGRRLPLPQGGAHPRVAVVAHVFYAELWPELLWRLRRIDVAYSLYVTLPETDEVLGARIKVDRPDAIVATVPNQGRDLGALLAVWPMLERDGVELVCKVHTKRGGCEPDTWRHLLIEGVLGKKAISQVVENFRQDVFLTMVGPQQVYLAGDRWTNRSERQQLAELLVACGVSEEPPVAESWGFFAGSCFWFRLNSFRCIGQLAPPSYETSNAEREGQRSHALERLFGALAARRGDRVGFTDMSGPEASAAVTVRRAPGPSFRDDFPTYLRRRTVELASARSDVPVRQRRAWTAPADRPLGVTFVGPVEAVNGLGVSARGFVRAIQAAGVPLGITPWRLGFDRVRHEMFDAPRLGPQPINIVHLNLDLMHTGRLLEREPLKDLINDTCFNVLIISWELLSLPPEWGTVLEAFDEVWASSRFMVTGVRSISRTPVRVVRPALVEPSSVDSLPLAPGQFLFGYIADSGSLLQRKNPEQLWRTYSETFGPADGAALVIKLHYPDVEDPLYLELLELSRRREDVLLIAESLSEPALASLMSRIDAYVSPHRSEGLGLTILEAMMAAKPVVCTDFGGCTEFADAYTAFPVARRLVRVGEGAAPYPPDALWADPLSASLGAQMRRVFRDRAAAAAVAAEGRRRALSMFSTAIAAQGVRTELRRIWLSGGGSEATLESSLSCA